MALLEVLHFPDNRLRKKAALITELDETVSRLAADMLETMYAENGIGLAATQVNVHKRLVVIDVSEERNQPMVFINPEIIASSGTEEMKEGCLSVPDIYDTVQRAEFVKVRYTTLDGREMELETGGLLAVCIQHELDHLNGKLFIDYLSPLKRGRIAKKAEKQERFQSQPV